MISKSIKLLIILACLSLAILVFLKERPVIHKPETKEKAIIVWGQDFNAGPGKGPFQVPDNWRLERKPGTPPAVFSILKNKEGDDSYLHMEADKASASLVTRIDDIGLEQDVKHFGNGLDPIAFVIQKIYDINQTAEKKIRLLLTTNLNKTELTEKYGQRVISRLWEMCEPIVLEDTSFR